MGNRDEEKCWSQRRKEGLSPFSRYRSALSLVFKPVGSARGRRAAVLPLLLRPTGGEKRSRTGV